MKTILATIALLLFAGVSQADSVWTYAGNADSANNHAGTLNPCQCSLTGTVILDASDHVLGYSFTAGGLTLDNLNSTAIIDPFSGFGVTQNGPFFTWRIILTGALGSIYSDFYGSIGDATDSSSSGLLVEGHHGIFTDPVSTPEPSQLRLLLGASFLIGAGFLLGRMYDAISLKRLA